MEQQYQEQIHPKFRNNKNWIEHCLAEIGHENE
jgi:hypothetical protein